MRTDPVVIRPGAFVGYMGREWLYIAAYLKLKAAADRGEFRKAIPARIEYHHENSGTVRDYQYVEKTGEFVEQQGADLLVGFYARDLGHAYDQVQLIKNMDEVEGLVDYIIKHTHDVHVDLTVLDWRILKVIRRGGPTEPADVARRLECDAGRVSERLDYLGQVPLGFFIGSPHPKDWLASLLLLDFRGTTHSEALPHLARIVGHPDDGSAPSFTFRVFTRPERSCAALVPAENEDQLRSYARRFTEVRGVRVVGAWTFDDIHMTQPWLDEFIEQRIATAG